MPVKADDQGEGIGRLLKALASYLGFRERKKGLFALEMGEDFVAYIDFRQTWRGWRYAFQGGKPVPRGEVDGIEPLRRFKEVRDDIVRNIGDGRKRKPGLVAPSAVIDEILASAEALEELRARLLGDEDYLYLDLHLDNFIGREIARELKLELDQMEDFEAKKPKAEVEQLLQENIRLKKEKDELQEKLSNSEKKLEELKEKAEEGPGGEEELSQLKSKMEEKEEEYKRLKRYCEGLEDRLKRCLQRREPKKLARMARILKLGMEAVRFTPSYASRQLGMRPHMINDYLAELVEAGMLKKIQRGYYEVGEDAGEDDLEEEVARRLAGGRQG
jgi:DNA repair exonuclease SbcCD ATPase subunit